MSSGLRCRRCGAQCAIESLYCSECGTLLVAPSQWSWRGPQPPRPKGWFRDPTGRFPRRYWSGDAWTDAVEGAAADGSGLVPSWDTFSVDPRDDDQHGTFAGPRRTEAIGYIAAGFFAALGLSGFASAIWVLFGRPGGPLTLLVVSEIGLWVGFIETGLLVSRRFGTGSIRHDFRLRLRWYDVGIGAIGGVLGRLAATAIASALDMGGAGGRPNQVFGVTGGTGTWIVLVLLTCVGAPFFEELFFRGLLQSALVGRYGPWVGLPVTAAVFGSAHVFNAPGYSGVVYALAVMGGGLVLGVTYAVFGRLGASMSAHSWFNGLALVGIASVTIH